MDGFAAWAAAGYPAAVPLFRRAIAMLLAGDLSPAEGLRGLRLGYAAAGELFDDEAQHALAIRWVQLARDQGALTALPVALDDQGALEVGAGRFDAARACFAERSGISAATGNPGVVGTAGIAEAYELAWRGRETDARRVAAAVAGEATDAGRSAQGIWVQYCLAVLELGLGNYQAALQCVLGAQDDDAPYSALVLPDLVEAGARCGKTELAEAALERLAERAPASGTPLALGLLAWSRALLAGDDNAGPLTSRPSRTWSSAAPHPSSPAPTWCTANGCAASAAAATRASSCGSRMTCLSRWAPPFRMSGANAPPARGGCRWTPAGCAPKPGSPTA